MEKMRKFFDNKLYLGLSIGVAFLLVAVILLAVLLPDRNNTPPVAEPITGCTVEVKSEGGKALEDIGVYIYKDATKTDMVDYVKTNEQGVATISGPVPTGSIAVLDKVPEGYVVLENYSIIEANTKIMLPIQLRQQISQLALGDVMFDFTVTDTNGTQQTLSKLLETKKAVVINLWFVNCNPCRAEFPYLVEAYGNYADSVEVLAINPEGDSAEDIATFVQEQGLTFPTAKGDAAWKGTIATLAYPTTIIVDRFGTVGLIHTGSIDNAKIFEDAFAYFTADDYVQSTVKNITDVATEDEKDETPAAVGTQENPDEFAGVTEFEITVAPGADYYCNVYRVSGMELKVESQTLKLTYGETVCQSEEGVVKLQLPTTTDPNAPFVLCFTNTGAEEQTYKVTFAYPEGAMENPLVMQLGEVSVKVAEGNDQGTYLTYTAQEDGNLTLKGLKKNAGYNVVLYNLTTFVQNTLEEDAVETDGETVLFIPVVMGDEVQILVTSNADSEGNCSAVSVSLTASVEQEEEEPTEITEPEVTEPQVTEPEITEPEITEPEITEPEVTEPEVTEPEVTEPEVTEPEVTEPEVTEPEVTEPEVTEPEVTEPENTEPEVTEPAGPNYDGTLVNPDEPIEHYGFENFSIDVGVGEKKLVYMVRTINEATLCLYDEDAYVVHKGKTYKPSNGAIYITMESKGSFTPIEFEIGNSGSSEKTFDVLFYFAEGTRENPGTLKVGENTVKCASGNEQGTFYTFKASSAGTLTLEVKNVKPDDVICQISISDMQYVPTVVELEEGSTTVSIALPAGAKAEIVFSAKDPNREWKKPAAEFAIDVTFQ